VAEISLGSFDQGAVLRRVLVPYLKVHLQRFQQLENSAPTVTLCEEWFGWVLLVGVNLPQSTGEILFCLFGALSWFDETVSSQ
jgi:hypothetical protein